MEGPIFHLDHDGVLRPMTVAPYDTEDVLQALVEQHAELLVGDQVNPVTPRQWVLVSREVGVPGAQEGGARWSLDHLFLDQDGVPTLVEVKRSSDTRIRREVVGQMLDYAANGLVYWPPDSIRGQFEARCRSIGQDPEEQIRSIASVDTDYEQFWSLVRQNLQTGRVRLIFLADAIPPELRRIVEFLNEQMARAEVLAIEVKQYVGEGGKTLVPRLIGATATAERTKGATSSRQTWDPQSYFAEFERRNGSAATGAAKEILAWCGEHASTVWWGTGTQSGSFAPFVRHAGTDYPLFALYTYGSFEVYFQYLGKRPPFDSVMLRRELAARLNQVGGVEIPEDALSRRPSIRIEALTEPQPRREVLRVYEWVIDMIRAYVPVAGPR